MKLHINTILALTLMVSASANAKDKEPLAPRAITMCTLVMKKSLEFAVQRLSTGAAQPTNGFLPTLNSVDDRLEGLYQKEIEARAFSLGRTIEQLPKDSATLMSTPDRPLDSEVETRYNIYKMRRQLDIVREHLDDEIPGTSVGIHEFRGKEEIQRFLNAVLESEPDLTKSVERNFDFISEYYEREQSSKPLNRQGIIGFAGTLVTGIAALVNFNAAQNGNLDQPALWLLNAVVASTWATPQIRRRIVQWLKNRASAEAREQNHIELKNSAFFRGKDLYDYLDEAFDLVGRGDLSSNDFAYYSKVSEVTHNFYQYLRSLNGTEKGFYIPDIRSEEENQVRPHLDYERTAEMSLQLYLEVDPYTNEPGLLVVTRLSRSGAIPPSRRKQEEKESRNYLEELLPGGIVPPLQEPATVPIPAGGGRRGLMR